MSQLLIQIVGRLPYLIVWIVAVVLAIVRYDRHPVASVLIWVGAALSGLNLAATMMLPSLYSRDPSHFQIASIAIAMVGTGALGCVVAAVFIERAPPNPPTSF